MLAKGTARGVKPKEFAGGYRQGWIFFASHKVSQAPTVAEVSNLPSSKDIPVLREKPGTHFE